MQEQLLDNRRRLYLHLVSQLFDCKALWQRDHLNLLFNCIFRLFLRLDELAGLILALDILNILAVLFIDQIFAVPLILLLTDAALFLVSMLLGIFNRAFWHKAALSTLIAKSAFIVAPAIKSLSGSIALTLAVTALAVISVIIEISLAVAALTIVAVIVAALTVISVIVKISLAVTALTIVAALAVISVIVPIIISIVIPVIVKITLAVAALVFTPVIIPIIVEITLTVAALVFTPVIMLTPIISLCWF